MQKNVLLLISFVTERRRRNNYWSVICSDVSLEGKNYQIILELKYSTLIGNLNQVIWLTEKSWNFCHTKIHLHSLLWLVNDCWSFNVLMVCSVLSFFFCFSAVFLQNTLRSCRSEVTAICEPSAKFLSTEVWRVWILKRFSPRLSTARAMRATWGLWAPLARFLTFDHRPALLPG